MFRISVTRWARRITSSWAFRPDRMRWTSPAFPRGGNLEVGGEPLRAVELPVMQRPLDELDHRDAHPVPYGADRYPEARGRLPLPVARQDENETPPRFFRNSRHPFSGHRPLLVFRCTVSPAPCRIVS